MEPENNTSLSKCPECGKSVYRSRRRGVDRLLPLFGRRPFRCRSCGKRFYLTVSRSARPKAPGRAESRKRKREASRREAMVYLFALIVFAAAVVIMVHDRG